MINDMQVLIPSGDSLLVVDADGMTNAATDVGSVQRLAVSPGGQFIAAFTADSRLSVWLADFTRNLSEFTTEADTPPSALAWCGTDAVAIAWPVRPSTPSFDHVVMMEAGLSWHSGRTEIASESTWQGISTMCFWERAGDAVYSSSIIRPAKTNPVFRTCCCWWGRTVTGSILASNGPWSSSLKSMVSRCFSQRLHLRTCPSPPK